MDVNSRIQTAPRVPPGAVIIVMLLALLAIGGVLALAAGQPRPAPFGVARNGGVVFHDAQGDIVMADPSTGDIGALVGGPAWDSHPVMSPDGARIAFQRGTMATDTRPALWVAEADGSDARELLTADHRLDRLVWSPTGDRIVIHREGAPLDELVVVSTHDGATTTIATGIDTQTVLWRPGMDQLVVAGEQRIGTVGLDGTDFQPLVDDPGLLAAHVTVSPDGALVAYSSWTDGAEGRIQLVELGTARHREVDFDPGVPFTDLMPRFFPDSQRLLIDRYDIEGYRPTILPIDGAPPLPLGDHHLDGTDGSRTVIAPDGNEVLVTYLDDETSWLFDARTGTGREMDWAIQRDAWKTWQRLGG